MKKNILVIFSLLTICYSCSKSDDSVLPEAAKEEVSVSFAFKGEVMANDSPLNRAVSDDIYGIQIYKDGIAYANGVFNDVSKMKTTLDKSGNYSFKCTLVKNGVNTVYGNGHDYYYEPFSKALENNFKITSSILTDLTRSTHTTKGSRTYPQADRYYGELAGYTPIEDDLITIDLKHMVFGLQVSVTDIPDGMVEVEVGNNKATFVHQTEIVQNYQSDAVMYECYSIRDAWNYLDSYTEKVNVHLTWTREVGVIQDLGTKEVELKRNAMNRIHIKLSANDGDAQIGIRTDATDFSANENVNMELK